MQCYQNQCKYLNKQRSLDLGVAYRVYNSKHCKIPLRIGNSVDDKIITDVIDSVI